MRDSVSGLRGSLGADAGHFLPYHLMDFWLNLALCHALLVDTSDGDAQYQVCATPILCGHLSEHEHNRCCSWCNEKATSIYVLPYLRLGKRGALAGH